MKKNFWLNPVLGAFLLTLLMLSLLYVGTTYKISWLTNYIPTIFTGMATLLVGLYAFTLYQNQKDDHKKDVASILLQEIQNAEKVLKRAQLFLERPIPELPNDVIVMPTESWNANKYLFVKDFDNNEWESISEFYNACSLFDDAVRTNASYFQKNEEQVRVNIHQRSAHLTKEYSDRIELATTVEEKTKLQTELRVKIDEYTNLYLSSVTEYMPVKPIKDALLCITTLKLNISLPNAIKTLKDLT